MNLPTIIVAALMLVNIVAFAAVWHRQEKGAEGQVADTEERAAVSGILRRQ